MFHKHDEFERALRREKEVLGGFYLIEAESLDEALVWAERARFIPGSNEVRAVLE